MKGIHLITNAGFSVPLELIQKISKAHQGGFGLVTANPNGNGLFVYRSPKAVDPGELHQVMEGYKDQRMLVTFNMAPSGGLIEKDLQPFTLLDKDGDPLLVAALDGDFSEYREEETPRSDESYCIEKALLPRIQKLNKFLNGDIAAIMEELKDPISVHDIVNMMIGSNGSISLFSRDACETFTLQSDDRNISGDWGWCSNGLGYSEKKEEVAPEKPANSLMSALSALGGKKKETASVVPAKGSAVEAKPGAGAGSSKSVPARPGGAGKGPSVAVASTEPINKGGAGAGNGNGPAGKADDVPAVQGTGSGSPTGGKDGGPTDDFSFTLKVPMQLGANKRKRWISVRISGGILPTNWREMTALTLIWKDAPEKARAEWRASHPIKNFSDLPKSTATAIPAGAGGDKLPARPGATKSKSESGYPPRENDPPLVNAGAEDNPEPKNLPAKDSHLSNKAPIMSTNSKAKLANRLMSQPFKDAVDRHQQLISNPAEFAKEIKKYPDFKSQAPLLTSLSDTYCWPYDVMYDINVETPDSGAVLMFHLALDNQRKAKQIEELEQMLADLTQPEGEKKTGTGGGSSSSSKLPARPRVAL